MTGDRWETAAADCAQERRQLRFEVERLTRQRSSALRECIETPEVLAAIEAALNTVAHERHAGLAVSDQAEAVRVMSAVLRAALGDQEAQEGTDE